MLTQKEVDRRASAPNNIRSLEDMNRLYGKKGFNWGWGIPVFVAGGIDASLILAIQYHSYTFLAQMLPTAEASSWAMSRFWEHARDVSVFTIAAGYLVGKITGKKEGYTLPGNSWQQKLLRRATVKTEKANISELQDIPSMTELVERSREARLRKVLPWRNILADSFTPQDLVESSRQQRWARYPLAGSSKF